MTIPLRKNFTRAELASVCRLWGPKLGPLPTGVNPTQFLWAIAGVESSFGGNCQARHEPAYDVGGKYAAHTPLPTLLSRYGSAGACSYGPWQILLCNAPLTYDPASFDQLTLAVQATVTFMNQLFRHLQPANLAEAAEIWNSGGIHFDPDYVTKVEAAYKTVMP